MTYCTASILTLLLNYLASSEGALSAPLNLTVDVLDFQAYAQWNPGADNPAGTRYCLEFIDIEHYSKPVWNSPEGCTNITSTHCHLTLHILWLHYFIRVRAEWEQERSNWTLWPITIQPYKDSRLSPPNLVVSTDQYSIYIQLTHPVQGLKDVPLRFSIDLFQVISDNTTQHVAQDTSTGNCSFLNLPPGNYCINTSAFYAQWSQRVNYNTTHCFSLAEVHTGRVVYVIWMGLALLLIFTTGIALSVICCNVKPQSNRNYTPKALYIIEGTAMILTVTPDECHTVSHSNTAHSDTESEEEDDTSLSGYIVNMYSARIAIRRGSSTNDLEAAHFTPRVDDSENDLSRNSDLYSKAVKIEEPEGDLLQQDPYSCLPMEPIQFSSVIISSVARASFDKDNQETGIESPLSNHADMDAEECAETNYQSEGTKSSEGVTDFLYPEFGLGNYEPRPDPRFITWSK